MDSTRKTRLRRKESTKQNIWNYMRRNTRFRVGDIMMILEVSDSTIRPIIWALHNAKYIRLENKAKEYKDRIYTFINNTGIKSPSIVNGEVYDHNTKDVVIKKEDVQKKLTDYKMRLQLLTAMCLPVMSKEEIVRNAKISRTFGWAKKEFLYFRLRNILTRTDPIERKEGKILFNVNKEKRDELISDIEASLRPVRSA